MDNKCSSCNKKNTNNNTIMLNISKEVSNILFLSKVRSNSLENLFMSYINNTTEEANKINLEKFIELYQENISNELIILMNIIKENKLNVDLTTANVVYNFDKDIVTFVG